MEPILAYLLITKSSEEPILPGQRQEAFVSYTNNRPVLVRFILGEYEFRFMACLIVDQ